MNNGYGKIAVTAVLSMLFTSLGWALVLRNAEHERPTRQEMNDEVRKAVENSPYSRDRAMLLQELKNLNEGQTQLRQELKELQKDMTRLLDRPSRSTETWRRPG